MMDLPKIDNSNLWDKTYNILKEQIIHRKFQPNEKLSIPDLAKQLGVSRTPIRDAMNRLEMDGLVRTVSKVGTFVNAIDENTINDIMDTRLMLEFWVIEKIPFLEPEQIEKTLVQMEAILERKSQSISSEQFDSNHHADINLEFHLEFIRMGNNRKNTEIYQNMMNYRFMATKLSLISKEMVESALEQHYTFIDAVKSGKPQVMRDVIRLHLEDSQNRLLEKIKSNGGSI
jgi:DNA-binding GntR family transcriptional regulator